MSRASRVAHHHAKRRDPQTWEAAAQAATNAAMVCREEGDYESAREWAKVARHAWFRTFICQARALFRRG